jgi:hypothetical protein
VVRKVQLQSRLTAYLRRGDPADRAYKRNTGRQRHGSADTVVLCGGCVGRGASISGTHGAASQPVQRPHRQLRVVVGTVPQALPVYGDAGSSAGALHHNIGTGLPQRFALHLLRVAVYFHEKHFLTAMIETYQQRQPQRLLSLDVQLGRRVASLAPPSCATATASCAH